MSIKPFRWPLRVRFSDTDASGRIHYTAMFRFFEAAEQEFLRALGFSYAAAASAEIGFPRVHTECDFLAAVSHDDQLLIEVSVERVGKSSFTLAYLATLDGQSAAKGRITVVAIDKNTQKARPLPTELAQALGSV